MRSVRQGLEPRSGTKLQVCVNAGQADDMDSFVAVPKADERGNFLPTLVSKNRPHARQE